VSSLHLSYTHNFAIAVISFTSTFTQDTAARGARLTFIVPLSNSDLNKGPHTLDAVSGYCAATTTIATVAAVLSACTAQPIALEYIFQPHFVPS
jgi:hypothetical protein